MLGGKRQIRTRRHNNGWRRLQSRGLHLERLENRLLLTLLGSWDTDGDGALDDVYDDGSYVRIERANGSSKSYHLGSSWSHLETVDTNGIAGQELVFNTGLNVEIIRDFDRSSTDYFLGSSWSHLETVDTNGIAGQELVFNTGLNVEIIRDFDRSSTDYFLGSSWSHLETVDTNGIAGQELVFNTGLNVEIIRDFDRSSTDYFLGSSWSHLETVDTNGIAGQELVFNTGLNVEIIRDFDRSSTDYFLGSSWSHLETVDTNGIAGQELVFNTGLNVEIIRDFDRSSTDYFLGSSWSHLETVDTNGIAGQELVFNTGLNVEIIRDFDRSSTDYFLGSSWSHLETVDTNGIAGQELVFNTGLNVEIIRDFDRSSTDYFLGSSWSYIGPAQLDEYPGMELQFIVNGNPYIIDEDGNTGPTISDIVDQVTNEDTPTGPIAFVIDDYETPEADLILDGSSSNTSLVPNGNIVFGGSGENRTVTITPALNHSGTAVITVTVSDGELQDSDTFQVTVSPVNDEENLERNYQLAVDKGEEGVISSTLLLTTDVDNSPAELTYTITAGPSNGWVLLSGSPATSLTQADIDAGLVTYQHDGSVANSDSFTFHVDDGTGSSTSATFQIGVTFPGDFDGDGYVGAADLVIWKDGFGATSGASPADGDADGDEDVDLCDLLNWQRDFNPPPAMTATTDGEFSEPFVSPSVVTVAAIAEPSTTCLSECVEKVLETTTQLQPGDDYILPNVLDWWLSRDSSEPSDRELAYRTDGSQSVEAGREQFFTQLAESQQVAAMRVDSIDILKPDEGSESNRRGGFEHDGLSRLIEDDDVLYAASPI